MRIFMNGYYIYFDDDEGRWIYCDYKKGITDTANWYNSSSDLFEYIAEAVHVFKSEKLAQKFIDEHLKYFADKDKVMIGEVPSDGIYEEKKSLKESRDNWTSNTLRGELMKLGYFIDDLHDKPTERHANEVIRQAETVIDFCETVIYELKKDIHQHNFDESKSMKEGRNVGYKKMGDIVANLDWDKLDSASFKNMGYRLDDFYVDERFAINQKDYMKAFNECEDNPKMLGKEVAIKATRVADNQPLIIICELDSRADVEKLYMYDFNIIEVMLDTF